jgi:hypothetical protein
MEVLLALLHLAAFVTLGIAIPVPAVRRPAIAALALAAVASVTFGVVESGERTLETVHSYAGFAGHDLEVSMVPFPTGTVTAAGWLWPVPFAAFAMLWIAVLAFRGREPLRFPIWTALVFAWTATGCWLAMQMLAAPSAIVQPVGLDRVLFPAGLAAAIGAGRTRERLLPMLLVVSSAVMAARVPVALFSNYATDFQLGTVLDTSRIRDIVNPMTQMQFDPRLVPGSGEHKFVLIWLEHLIVFPALYLMSLSGVGFCVLMFHQHGGPNLRKVD